MCSVMGSLSSCHPYLTHNASLKACLWRQNPNSWMGRAVSQLEAPFSLAWSISNCCDLGSCGLRTFARSCAEAQFFNLHCSLCCLLGGSRVSRIVGFICSMIKEISGFDILSDNLNWLGALLVGIGIPRPEGHQFTFSIAQRCDC